MTGQPFPECEDGLVCELAEGLGIPGAENICKEPQPEPERIVETWCSRRDNFVETHDSPIDAFNMMYLESTNGYRRAHEVYDLKFSQDLANDAQAYAVQMQALYDSTDDIGIAFMHSDASTRPGQGENLGYYEAFPPNPALISETTYINDQFYLVCLEICHTHPKKIAVT